MSDLEHIKAAADEAVAGVLDLIRVMVNLGATSYSRKRLLMSATQSLVVH